MSKQVPVYLPQALWLRVMASLDHTMRQFDLVTEIHTEYKEVKDEIFNQVTLGILKDR